MAFLIFLLILLAIVYFLIKWSFEIFSELVTNPKLLSVFAVMAGLFWIPKTTVVLLIASGIFGLVYAYKTNETFKKFVLAIYNFFKNIAKQMIEDFKYGPSPN